MSLGASTMRAFRSEIGRWHACALKALPPLVVLPAGMMARHALFLTGVSNNVASAADVVPSYVASIVAFPAFALAGWLMQRKSAKAAGWRACAVDVCGCVLVLSSVLVSRLPFYASYLSAGF